MKNYRCLVIGAGHAGLEAVFAFANKGYDVALFCMDERLIGNMPCNPSIGGPGKGVITREIDALGGEQGKAADACQLQMKLLNSSKGAGVWALRAQIDKVKYHEYFLEKVKNNKYIDLINNEVEELIVENKKVIGLKTSHGNYYGDCVIICTGTFLDAKIFRGEESFHEGPGGFGYASKLSQSLKEQGFTLIRLKTGTPARVKRDSVNFDILELEPGTNKKLSFSHYQQIYLPFDKQWPCYITYTNEKTHQIVRDNLSRSSMYGGWIDGVGPRYCPSIEDKVVKFSDKSRHQIFIEPESANLDTVYLAGISNSLPKDVQEKLVHSIKGLENCVIDKYAYAIEYDAIDSNHLYPTLESKLVDNLYFAGQINGTSGYEEAAAQGLMAAINAILKIEGKEPLILKRSEAYIGVLIDDIVTKKLTEPYRILTSLAEHRLCLRNDNADERLMKYGYNIGLISDKQYNEFLSNFEKMNKNIEILKNNKINIIKDKKFDFKKMDISLYELIKKQEYTYQDVQPYLEFEELDDYWEEKINISIKFEGYIKNQQKVIENYEKLYAIKLGKIKDYKDVPNISLEARDKLNKVMPMTLDQASRISGINLNDLMNIKLYLEKERNNNGQK